MTHTQQDINTGDRTAVRTHLVLPVLSSANSSFYQTVSTPLHHEVQPPLLSYQFSFPINSPLYSSLFFSFLFFSSPLSFLLFFSLHFPFDLL